MMAWAIIGVIEADLTPDALPDATTVISGGPSLWQTNASSQGSESQFNDMTGSTTDISSGPSLW